MRSREKNRVIFSNRTMNKTELRHIAEDLIEDLREMPDGAEITSAQLLEAGGYNLNEFEFTDLMEYHQALFRAAKANRITLDMSKHEGMIEGLPFNLEFVVRNQRAQIKCPYCGSTNTARILYGMPSFSDKLQEKLDSGKLRLGGCCIKTVNSENGEIIQIDPERHCNNCGREFGHPAYLVSRDRKTAESYSDIITGIHFSSWYERSPWERIDIDMKKNRKGIVVYSAEYLTKNWEEVRIQDQQITWVRWMHLLGHLYNDLYVHDWKHHSENNDHDFWVLDGEDFSLEITMTNRRKRTYTGNVEYLPYWPELKALFRPFLRG